MQQRPALALARGDGRYAKLLKQLARVDLLILDDWGPEPLIAEQQRDLLEIVEDRYNAGSLIITSQVPIDRWHDIVGKPNTLDCHSSAPLPPSWHSPSLDASLAGTGVLAVTHRRSVIKAGDEAGGCYDGRVVKEIGNGEPAVSLSDADTRDPAP